jgi:hypothetical protein
VRGRNIWLWIGALVVLRVVVVIAALSTDATAPGRNLPGDVERYHEIALSHGTPYRDFDVEYPPVTLAAIDALDGGSLRSATVNLMVSQLVLDVVTCGLLIWAWGTRTGFAYLILGLPFVLYPFIYLRLDLLSVALAVATFALLRRHHPRWAGVLLAIACFAKIWPLALVPVLLFARNRRALLPFAAVGSAGLALWIAFGGPDGVRQVATFRGSRGWEIESVVGSIARTGAHSLVYLENGAYRVGEVPGWATVLLLAIGLGVVVAVWLLAARRGGADSSVVVDGLAPVAAICATLVTATIISPQYLFWLLPFAAIVAVDGELLIAELVVVVSALSVLEFGQIDQLIAGDAFPVIVVIVRNVVLLGVLAACIYRLSSAPASRVDAAVSVEVAPA